MEMNPDKLRKRFHDLTAQAAKIRAKSDPIRAKRDKAQKDYMESIGKQNEALKKAEDGLFEIEQERAMIARALGGRVGESG